MTEPTRTSGQAATATEVVRYETEIVAIGAMVPEFLESGLLILFGEMAPPELHDIVVRHRPTIEAQVPRPGDILQIDDARLVVTSVGSVVADNLLRLGHASLRTDGAEEAGLPGDISLQQAAMPVPQPGSVLRFVAPAGPDPRHDPEEL